MLGAGRYRLAHGREEIDRSVSVGRVGRELYPCLICIVALALRWNICWGTASIGESKPRRRKAAERSDRAVALSVFRRRGIICFPAGRFRPLGYCRSAGASTSRGGTMSGWHFNPVGGYVVGRRRRGGVSGTAGLVRAGREPVGPPKRRSAWSALRVAMFLAIVAAMLRPTHVYTEMKRHRPA